MRCGQHSIAFVHLTSGIDKNRPLECSIFNVATGKKVAFKRNHNHFHIQPAKFIFLITQLRDMRSAGESTKMPMKNQQEPTAFILFQGVQVTITVMNGKIIRRLTSQITHCGTSVFFLPLNLLYSTGISANSPSRANEPRTLGEAIPESESMVARLAPALT